MPDEKLVLVERFEELREGMRVVDMCRQCGGRHVGFLGEKLFSENLTHLGSLMPPAWRFRMVGAPCPAIFFGIFCISEHGVKRGEVFRFSSDLGIDDQIASEENPYTSRSVVGAGGVDEVRVPAKERR